MALSEIMTQPLSDVLAECDVVDLKVHNREDGSVCSIEVKYVPKDSKHEKGCSNPGLDSLTAMTIF